MPIADPFEIPAFLRLTPEERRLGRGHPLAPLGTTTPSPRPVDIARTAERKRKSYKRLRRAGLVPPEVKPGEGSPT
jgi:hypothetical protein